jgi:hypothetical protein
MIARIQIQGIVSAKSRKLLELDETNWDETNWYWVSYSPEHILAGDYGVCKILETCDQFANRFDYIPRGWKMAVRMDGVDDSLIPVLDSWGYTGKEIFIEIEGDFKNEGTILKRSHKFTTYPKK